MNNHLLKMSFYYPELYKAISIDSSQKALLSFIKNEGWCSSNFLSVAFKVSIPCISTRLKLLMDKGFLVRESTVHASGGIMYVYYVHECLRDSPQEEIAADQEFRAGYFMTVR